MSSDGKKASALTKPQRPFPPHSIESAIAIAKTIAKYNAGNPWGSEQVASAMSMGAKAPILNLSKTTRNYVLLNKPISLNDAPINQSKQSY